MFILVSYVKKTQYSVLSRGKSLADVSPYHSFWLSQEVLGSGSGVTGCSAPALLTQGLPSFCENTTRGQQAPCAHKVPAAEHSDKPRASCTKGTASGTVPSGAANTEFPPNTTARAMPPRHPLRLYHGTSAGSPAPARRPAAPGTGAPGPAWLRTQGDGGAPVPVATPPRPGSRPH